MSSKTKAKTGKLKKRTAKLQYESELNRRAAADIVAADAVRQTEKIPFVRQAKYKTSYSHKGHKGGKKKRKTQKRRK